MKKKKLFEIAFCVVMLLIFSLCLFSCGSNKELLGTWIDEDDNTLTFEKDWTCYEDGDSLFGLRTEMKYKIDGNELKITGSAFGITVVKPYTYSIENDVLHMVDKDLNIETVYYRSVEAREKELKRLEEERINSIIDLSEEQIKNDINNRLINDFDDDKHFKYTSSNLPTDFEFVFQAREQDEHIDFFQTVNVSYKQELWDFFVGTMNITCKYKWNFDSKTWKLYKLSYDNEPDSWLGYKYHLLSFLSDVTMLPAAVGTYELHLESINPDFGDDIYTLDIDENYKATLKAHIVSSEWVSTSQWTGYYTYKYEDFEFHDEDNDKYNERSNWRFKTSYFWENGNRLYNSTDELYLYTFKQGYRYIEIFMKNGVLWFYMDYESYEMPKIK